MNHSNQFQIPTLKLCFNPVDHWICSPLSVLFVSDQHLVVFDICVFLFSLYVDTIALFSFTAILYVVHVVPESSK